MSDFVWGALGVIFAFVLLGGGLFAGWKLHDLYQKKTAAAVKHEISEKEKQRLAEDAAAFGTLMGYSADVAYGIVKLNEEEE